MKQQMRPIAHAAAAPPARHPLTVPGRSSRARAGVVLALALAAFPGGVWAQGPFAAQCNTSFSFYECAEAAQAAMLLQPRVALSATGGSPVPGTPGPLGWRHIRFGLRTSATRAARPPLYPEADGSTTTIPAVSGEALVGVFGGFTLLPSLAGVGALDVFGTAGLLPGVRELQGVAVTGGAGVRLGVVGESPLLPGVTLSAAFRAIGPTRLEAQSELIVMDSAQAAYYHLWPPPSWRYAGSVYYGHMANTSVRAVAGKHVRGLGLAAGVGWDRVQSSVRVGAGNAGAEAFFQVNRVTQQRVSAFGNLTVSLPRVEATVELGWQSGGREQDAVEGSYVTGYENLVSRSALFGGLSLRPRR